MDKRWRNLGILLVVVVVVVSAYFLINSDVFKAQTLDSTLAKNEYTNESFSFSVSSLVHPLDDKLVLDLKSLAARSSGNDKAVLEEIILLEKDKNVMMENYFDLLALDVVSRCDAIQSEEKIIGDKAFAIRERVAALPLKKTSFVLDINEGHVVGDYENMLISFSAMEDSCFELWDIMASSSFDQDFGLNEGEIE